MFLFDFLSNNIAIIIAANKTKKDLARIIEVIHSETYHILQNCMFLPFAS